MELGKVRGKVVTTVRDPQLPACSLLLVELVDMSNGVSGATYIAADPLGAGEGEIVLLTRGSSARLGFTATAPVDLCVVGIVDEVSESGRVSYSKNA